jgi:hypothetical protein
VTVNNPSDADDQSDEDGGRRKLAELYAEDGPADLEDGPLGPRHWPSIPAVDLAEEFRELYEWVEELVGRFPHLDAHVIPPCWWRHNSHVEALQALRDNERVNYADNAPGSAAASWHREFAMIEGRLREWTAHDGCGSLHREPLSPWNNRNHEEWENYVDTEVKRREASEITNSAR